MGQGPKLKSNPITEWFNQEPSVMDESWEAPLKGLLSIFGGSPEDVIQEPPVMGVGSAMLKRAIPGLRLKGHAVESDVGYVDLTPANKDLMKVMQSWVDAKFRGKGYGTALYQEAARLAKSLGYRGVMGGDAQSEDAINLWQRLREAPLDRDIRMIADDPTYGGPVLEATRLPMNEPHRRFRADTQGYTTRAYHGTSYPEDFTEFPDAVKLDDESDFGIHVALLPETAGRAATNGGRFDTYMGDAPPDIAGERILPLLVRTKKSLELPDMGMWRNPYHWQRAKDNPMPIADPIIFHRIQNLADDAMRRRMRGEEVETAFQQDLKTALQRDGYDSIRYKNYAEGRGDTSLLLLDPRQVKSQFATFDPKKFGKTRDIMAGIAGAAALHGLNEASPKKEKK